MAGVRKLITGFIAGELDPLMSGRVDTDQYDFGLETCENFVALGLGPLVKRAGFEYIRPAASTASWLTAFRFSILQEYVFEWSDHAVRFYTNGGRAEDGSGNPITLAVPYTAAEAPALSTEQSYDRLYIDHPAHPPASILRTGAVTFTFADLEFLNGPFQDENIDKDATVEFNMTTGDGVTITASEPIFEAGQVGSLFRVAALDFSTIKAWQPAMKDIVIGEVVRSDGKAYTAATAGKTGADAPIHTEGSEWDGQYKNDELNDKGPYGVQWTYKHDRFGLVKITTVAGDGMSATANVLRRIPDSLTSVPSWRWAEALFSNAAGWPSIVKLWEGRQIHIKDFDITASVVGDFGGGRVNYQGFTASGRLAGDLAFRRTLATNDPPLWAVADRKLVLGTASKELAVGPTNTQAAISGDNISSAPQSFYGSQAIDPVQIGVQTIFVERGGRRLRASDYDFTRDRYAAEDITASSRQVTDSGIKQLAYCRVPHPMLYAIRFDGKLAMHSDSKLAVKGFSRMVLGGGSKALSGVAVVGADGLSDELWLLVDRTSSGHGLEMWKQTTWRELGDDRRECFFVDGGTRIEAAANQRTFHLPHRANDIVDCVIDGAALTGLTVAADGTLTLPGNHAVPTHDYVLIVGLHYSAVAVTMAPEVKSQAGSIQGLRKRVRKVVLRVLETLGIRIGGANEGERQEEIIDRSSAYRMDNPIPFENGDISGLVDVAYDKLGRIRFSSDVPLPAVITAAMLNIEVDQGDA